MRKLFFIILVLSQFKAVCQSYPVTINKIRYLSDVADGTDITNLLKNIITLCKDGDVIVIPSGKFTITGKIDIINKEISIIGNGADPSTGTMLYRDPSIVANSPIIQYDNWYPDNPETGKIFVSGIFFKGRPSSIYGGESVADMDNGIEFKGYKNVYFTDNSVQYCGLEQIGINHKDLITGFNGLFFDNRILDGYRPEIGNYGYGIGIIGQNKTWISDPEFGSNKFVFVEDNYFRGQSHCVMNNMGGKSVVRYNIFEDNWTAAPIDGHGAGEYLAITSTRAVEVYNNTISTKYDWYGNIINSSTIPSRYSLTAIQPRGGEWLIYNNEIKNYQYGIRAFLEETNPGIYPYNYPSVYQSGYASGLKYGSNDNITNLDHGDGDIFAWNNSFDKKRSQFLTYSISSDCSDWLKFGRDFDTVPKLGYTAYPYPHPYRNYYYSFIDSLNSRISIDLRSPDQNQNSVVLTWNDMLCEDGYRIYMSANGTNYNLIGTTEMNIITSTIDNLTEGNQYWFYVVPYNDYHEGQKSKTIAILIKPYNLKYENSVIENAAPQILEIGFNLSLINIIPSSSAFTVKVNSDTRNISNIAISGNKVLLTLTNPIIYGDIVTVAYTKPSTNPLQTSSGSQAASFSAQNVINNIAAIIPTFVSSSVEDPTPYILEMNYSMTLANIIPSNSAFTVKVNSETRAINKIAISGNKVLLTLANPIVYGDIVTAAYTKPSTNPLQTSSGSQAASFSAQNVINNVAAIIPTFVSSSVENPTPYILEMNYSMTLANIIPSNSAFTVKVNSETRSISNIAISGNKVLLTLANPIVYGDIVTVAYTKPSTNPLQTSSGSQAASFSAQNVINNVVAIIPTFVSSSVEDPTPYILEMNYSMTLANIIPYNSAFTVKVNSETRNISNIAISGNKVLLTLANPIVYGDIVTVAYTKPSSSPLQTTLGGQVPSFNTQTVSNKVSMVNAPPVVVIDFIPKVYSGFVSELNASRSYDTNNDNLSFSWIPPASLSVSSTNESSIQFLSPIVYTPLTIEFTLEISDGKVSKSKTITVDIIPYKPELEIAEAVNIEASSYNSINYPFNAIDGSISTMWAADGDNQWLLIELKDPFNIQYINLAFRPGQRRKSFFDVLGSEDKVTWENILTKSASCDFSGDLQIFDFPPAKTEKVFKFVKFIGHSNSNDSWNYISEIKLFGYRYRIPSNYELSPVKIFPNPASRHIDIRIDDPNLVVDYLKITSISGRIMFQDKVDPEIDELLIPINLSDGIYFIQMGLGDLIKFTQKLIVLNR